MLQVKEMYMFRFYCFVIFFCLNQNLAIIQVSSAPLQAIA